MTEREDLETRVNQFICMELPGQPRAMHMGTSYLVNDMWKEIQRLRTELQAARAAPAQPCGCLIGTCESKPDRVCRMLQELQEGGHQ